METTEEKKTFLGALGIQFECHRRLGPEKVWETLFQLIHANTISFRSVIVQICVRSLKKKKKNVPFLQNQKTGPLKTNAHVLIPVYSCPFSLPSSTPPHPHPQP